MSYAGGQVNILNATSVDQIGKKTAESIAADNDAPLSYGYIDMAKDIVWSKMVWEFVDLNQKINLPYYFPIDTTSISNDRRSLFDTLMRGIKNKSIENVYSDSFFSSVDSFFSELLLWCNISFDSISASVSVE